MTPILVGLTGRAGSGKSTVAQYLEDEWAFHTIGFADPILEMIGALFAHCGIDGAWATERSLKELPTALGFSYRHLAQELGTGWGRGLRDSFWLRVASLAVAPAIERGDNIVISDVRYPNEAEWIVAQGGFVVRVLRAGRNADVRPHESEQYTDDIPAAAELLNHGSRATLYDQVDRLMEHARRESA